jgi:molybdate transport system substrate-binding protein
MHHLIPGRSSDTGRADHLRRASLGSYALALLVWGAGAAAPIGTARAEYKVAPDVVVFCEPTLRHALDDLGALWRKETGIPVRIFTSPTPALVEQVAHGARSDVLIGEGDASETAAAERHLIEPASIARLWRNQLVVAGRAGTDREGAPPDLAAAAGKEPIAIVDPWASSAGVATEKALQTLGLWQRVSAGSAGAVGTEDAIYLLTEGKARLAIIYASDAAADPALIVTDKLPRDSYAPIVYWAAPTEHALSPNAGKFIAFLHTPEARQKAQMDGLEMRR